MPDWTTTTIRAHREVITALLTPDHTAIDFNNLIPQPPTIETGPCTGRHDPDTICWRDWNIEHWGTKWNGDLIDLTLTSTHGTLTLDTAWSAPLPILFALSVRYPQHTINATYTYEGDTTATHITFRYGTTINATIT